MSSKIKRLLTWVAIATAAGLKATPLAEGLKNEPASQKIQGTIRLVTQRVNPADRLIDVFVSIPSGTEPLLAGYVRGEITVASREPLVVPKDWFSKEQDPLSVLRVSTVAIL